MFHFNKNEHHDKDIAEQAENIQHSKDRNFTRSRRHGLNYDKDTWKNGVGTQNEPKKTELNQSLNAMLSDLNQVGDYKPNRTELNQSLNAMLSEVNKVSDYEPQHAPDPNKAKQMLKMFQDKQFMLNDLDIGSKNQEIDFNEDDDMKKEEITNEEHDQITKGNSFPNFMEF